MYIDTVKENTSTQVDLSLSIYIYIYNVNAHVILFVCLHRDWQRVYCASIHFRVHVLRVTGHAHHLFVVYNCAVVNHWILKLISMLKIQLDYVCYIHNHNTFEKYQQPV
jgi:hypothetical protein